MTSGYIYQQELGLNLKKDAFPNATSRTNVCFIIF